MTQVGLQKQQEGALFPPRAAHHLMPHCMPTLIHHSPSTLFTLGGRVASTQGGRTEQLRWDLVQIHCVNGDTLVVVQVQCRNGNRAQLERAGPPCSQAAPRTTEQNNTKLTVCTLQHMTVLQLTLCVYVCVCVVQLCVFPGPHVVTFMRRLTSFLLNCADCEFKNGSACCANKCPKF